MSLTSFSIMSSSSSSRPRGSSCSVDGGAGGYGTPISRAPTSAYDMCTNEKVTMQNLNDRLASYLDQVRSLESANRKLELQILEYYEKTAHPDNKAKDYSAFLSLISDLRNKISSQQLENQSIICQMNKAQLDADDYKLKAENEMNLRSSVERDMSRMSATRDSLTQTRIFLELQIQGLKEELDQVKKHHQEELSEQCSSQGGSVHVEVDSADSVDLNKVLSEVRQQYEALMEKNKTELHRWFQTKVESVDAEVSTTSVEVTSFHSELSELKKTLQNNEISRESLLTEVGHLRQALQELQRCTCVQLTQLQVNVDALEAELQQIRVSMETQGCEYSTLLDLKMRLELEIEEYRRLLGGELEKKAVVINKVEEKVEEHKPHIERRERRTRTIIEEIVDGVVVNHKVDTQVEAIQ